MISEVASVQTDGDARASLSTSADAPPAGLVRVDDLPMPFLILDGEGLVTTANRAASDLLGTDVVGRPIGESILAEHHDHLRAEVAAADDDLTVEFRVHDHTGAIRWISARCAIERDGDGHVVRTVATWTDITDEVDARAASARFADLLEHVEDVVAIADPDGRLEHLNLAGRIMLEDENALDGVRLADLFAAESGRDIDEVALSTARHFGSWRGEVVLMPPDFEPRIVSLSVMAHYDAAGEVAYFSAMTRDITDLKAAEDALRRQATTDTLTGLPNRAILFDRLQHALQRSTRNGGGVALLFIDLDKFKAVNDHHGHDAGDELLVQVAQRLQSTVRECDTVARLGGDEFVVVAEPIIRFEDAKVVADRIVRNLSEPFELSVGTAEIGASVGLAMSERDITPRVLVKKADAAVYRAKAQGRSCVVIAD